MESDQGGDIFQNSLDGLRFFAYGKRFIVATDRLEDCGSVAICGFGIEPESLSSIDVV